MSVDQISDNCYVSTFQSTGVVVTFSDASLADSRESVISTRVGSTRIRSWGAANNIPQFREQVVMENNIVPSLLATKCDITLGGGLYAYKEVFQADGGKRNTVEVPMPAIMQDWMDKVDIDTYLDTAAKNLFFHANVFTEMTRTKGGEIDMIKAQECRHVRSGMQNEQGRVENYYLSGSWVLSAAQSQGIKQSMPIPVPAYNAKFPSQAKFIYHSGDSLLSDDYYYTPYWWGSLNWIELANAIPIFHKANINNGYTIRFHIEVPKGYFEQKPTTQAVEAINKASTEAQNKKQAFMEKVNDILAGASNAGRALFTEYDLNLVLGKDMPGIKITPINVDIKDQALLQLFEKSNQANISAQGIHPTLANIETAGRLSSGSEIRNAFLMYLIIKTPRPRRILLRPLNKIVREANGWPKDVHIGFRDMEITTLAESPAGHQEAAVE